MKENEIYGKLLAVLDAKKKEAIRNLLSETRREAFNKGVELCAEGLKNQILKHENLGRNEILVLIDMIIENRETIKREGN